MLNTYQTLANGQGGGRIDLDQLNQIIDAHLCKPLSVSEMARYMNISESHFYALFMKEFGQSPHQYLLHRRLHWARSFIIWGELKLTDIAYAIGFSSPSAFSRAFKQYFGCPPSHWLQEQ